MQFQGCLQENVDEKPKNKEEKILAMNEITSKMS